MSQMSFSDFEYAGMRKQTHRERFLCEMHQTKKGNQYLFGIKAHICADVGSGLVHHVHATAVNMADGTQVADLLYGDESAGRA